MGYDVIAVLTLIAMIAGFIDAVAGGGGLIALPTLLLVGIHPVSAIATNKLQAASATFSATLVFARKGMIEWRRALPIAFASFMGGMLGAISVSLLPKEFILVVVPILLIFVVVYFANSPKLDDTEKPPKLNFLIFGISIAPFLGFYDGIFGPGVGSFFLISFIYLMGMRLLRAMAYAKLANAACNLGSLSVFLFKGTVIFSVAICMALGAIVGAQIGAKFALKFGSKLVKPLLIIVSTVMALKLVLDPSNPIYKMAQSFIP